MHALVSSFVHILALATAVGHVVLVAFHPAAVAIHAPSHAQPFVAFHPHA